LISGGVLILSFCAFRAFALSLSVSSSSELFLALLCHFDWLCRFSCRLLAFAVFHLLDELLDLFLAFWVF
jgi:hypothetical protein